jgi:Cu+-exporting ATPase
MTTEIEIKLNPFENFSLEMANKLVSCLGYYLVKKLKSLNSKQEDQMKTKKQNFLNIIDRWHYANNILEYNQLINSSYEKTDPFSILRKMMEKDGVKIGEFEGKIGPLEAEGKTVVIVALNKKPIGLIAIADALKENSAEAVRELEALGIESIMLTGDNERTAKAIASQIGIKKVFANVLPHEKLEVIKKLQSEGNVVAMVGDGINDAPALAQSDVGIAIGSGTDVAKETGGIILIKDDLRDVVIGIKLSRETMRKIKQNLFWAFAYNTLAIPVAAFGLLNPIIAAAAMALSSLTVVVNSALLKRLKIWEPLNG